MKGDSMDLQKFEKFAAFWQQIAPAVKMAFITKTVTTTKNFKATYKRMTGHDIADETHGIYFPPIALEPVPTSCSTAAIGCNVFMPCGHVYEAIIRPEVTVRSNKSLVHLVWVRALNAQDMSLIQCNNQLFRPPKTGGEETEEKLE